MQGYGLSASGPSTGREWWTGCIAWGRGFLRRQIGSERGKRGEGLCHGEGDGTGSKNGTLFFFLLLAMDV